MRQKASAEKKTMSGQMEDAVFQRKKNLIVVEEAQLAQAKDELMDSFAEIEEQEAIQSKMFKEVVVKEVRGILSEHVLNQTLHLVKRAPSDNTGVNCES